MTTTTHKAEARGTIFYDGECNLCTAGAARLGPTLARRRFTAVPLQSPGAAEALGLSSDKLLDEVRLLTRDGRVLGGADALLHVARHVWWAWPLWLASFVPGVKPLLRYAYRRFVPYRYCVAGRCGRPAPAARTLARVVDAIPLILLPAAALLARPHVPPWAFMWLMAIAIFGGAKWLTCGASPPNCDEGRFARWPICSRGRGWTRAASLIRRPPPIRQTHVRGRGPS